MSELVIPTSGEVISLDNPEACLKVLNEIRELEAKLREAKAELTFALSQEFSRQGTKTLEFNGLKAELRGGSEIVWDVEVLGELRSLGLPEERMDDLIKAEVTFKVDTNQAKRIASANPEYQAVIERARQIITKPPYVSIKG